MGTIRVRAEASAEESNAMIVYVLSGVGGLLLVILILVFSCRGQKGKQENVKVVVNTTAGVGTNRWKEEPKKKTKKKKNQHKSEPAPLEEVVAVPTMETTFSKSTSTSESARSTVLFMNVVPTRDCCNSDEVDRVYDVNKVHKVGKADEIDQVHEVDQNDEIYEVDTFDVVDEANNIQVNAVNQIGKVN